jgi:hypothetical protein
MLIKNNIICHYVLNFIKRLLGYACVKTNVISRVTLRVKESHVKKHVFTHVGLHRVNSCVLTWGGVAVQVRWGDPLGVTDLVGFV